MHFDIVIVGGGLVGASLACALRDQPFKIAILDKNPSLHSTLADSLDARALALSLVSVQTLKTLKVWPQLESLAEAILEVHVSKQHLWGVTRIRANDYQLPALGYVVNADILNQVLTEVVRALPNVTCFRPDEIVQMERSETNTWAIHLKSQQMIKATVLVAADGADSYVRKHQGLGCTIHDHHQIAVVTNIELAQSHHGIAYERFTSTGSIAMIPFGDKRVKCVWAMPEEMATRDKVLSAAVWLKNIQTEFGFRLGRLQQIGSRIQYPLRTIHAESLYNDRLVFIGNAANTLHPIAAQGFNLGLRDVATLAEYWVRATQFNQDIGAVEVLRDYAQSRANDHQRVSELTACLADPNPMHWLGILACEGMPWVKRWVAKQGLGKQKTLAKLCRGVPL